MRIFIAAAAGLLFGMGLVISGMADSARVLAFLNLGAGWDPSLMLVMGGALLVTVPGFAWMRRRGKAFDGARLGAPAAAKMDRRLLAGAALFGLGWGLCGYCPGPGIVAAGLGFAPALGFVLTAIAGAWIADRIRL